MSRAMMLLAISAEGGGSAPAAPSGLVANQLTGSSARITWTDNSNNEDNFELWRNADGGAYSLINSPVTNDESYDNTGLTQDVTYGYKILATNATGDSAFSNVDTVNIPSAGPPPDAPSGLTATTGSASTIDLAWTDNSDDEVGFKIYRDGGLIATIATAGLQAYEATGLTEGTSYAFKVTAYNGDGESGFSNTDSAYTQLETPTSFVGVDMGSFIRFTWNANSGNAANQELYKDGGLHDTLSSSAVQYDESEPGSDGTWKIRAIHGTIPDSDFSTSKSGPPWPE